MLGGVRFTKKMFDKVLISPQTLLYCVAFLCVVVLFSCCVCMRACVYVLCCCVMQCRGCERWFSIGYYIVSCRFALCGGAILDWGFVLFNLLLFASLYYYFWVPFYFFRLCV